MILLLQHFVGTSVDRAHKTAAYGGYRFRRRRTPAIQAQGSLFRLPQVPVPVQGLLAGLQEAGHAHQSPQQGAPVGGPEQRPRAQHASPQATEGLLLQSLRVSWD